MTGTEVVYTYHTPSELRAGGAGPSELVLATSGDAAADADLISMLLAWDPRIDVGRLSPEAGLPVARVTAALSYLAASGRVGYDLAEEAFFHRELPFGAAALDSMHPRLGDARALVDAGAVTVSADGALVRAGTSRHRVTFAEPHDRCTCPWWGKHQGTRGPCKHVLAARMAAKPAAAAAEPAAPMGARA